MRLIVGIGVWGLGFRVDLGRVKVKVWVKAGVGVGFRCHVGLSRRVVT